MKGKAVTPACGSEETERGTGENRASIEQLGAGVGRVLQTCSRRSAGMGSGRRGKRRKARSCKKGGPRAWREL